jgi:hypothetical protein
MLLPVFKFRRDKYKYSPASRDGPCTTKALNLADGRNLQSVPNETPFQLVRADARTSFKLPYSGASVRLCHFILLLWRKRPLVPPNPFFWRKRPLMPFYPLTLAQASACAI